VEGVEGVYTDDTTSTQELDANTVETPVKAFLTAEFTMTKVGEDPSTLQTNRFVEESFPIRPPQQEWVVLTAMSHSLCAEGE
jgi:hypothetical protein